MDVSPDTVNTPFNHWWLRTGAWVEPPNQRRGGESGVQTLAQSRLNSRGYTVNAKSVIALSLGVTLWAAPPFCAKKKAMQALERLGVQVPKLVFYGAEKRGKDWHALLVTEALTGFIS